MFIVTNVKSYDVHHHYGTDWVTDYHIESDEELNVGEVIERITEAGYNPYGECRLNKISNGYILNTVMY